MKETGDSVCSSQVTGWWFSAGIQLQVPAGLGVRKEAAEQPLYVPPQPELHPLVMEAKMKFVSAPVLDNIFKINLIKTNIVLHEGVTTFNLQTKNSIFKNWYSGGPAEAKMS